MHSALTACEELRVGVEGKMGVTAAMEARITSPRPLPWCNGHVVTHHITTAA